MIPRIPIRIIHSTMLIIMIVTVSCKNDTTVVNETTSDTADIQNDKLTKSDIESIEYTEYVLSDTAEKITESWSAFLELNRQIEFLKEADLSFFKDDKDILRSTLTDLKNEIPETLNQTAIEVRLLALETNIFKLEGIAILDKAKKTDLIESVKDVLLSHTNLIFQINRKLEKDAQNIQKPN